MDRTAPVRASKKAEAGGPSSLQHLRVHDIDGLAFVEGADLVEDVGELHLVLLARDVAEVRAADHVIHLEQRMVAADHGLLVVHIHRRLARPSRAQRILERAFLDQRRAARVDEDRRRLHVREVLALDDAARGIDQAHVQAEDVALGEELLLGGSDGIAVGRGLVARLFARPDQHLHAERLADLRHLGADAAVAEDAERLAAHGGADTDLPFAGFQRGHLLRQVARRGKDQRPGHLRSGIRRRAGVHVGADHHAPLRAGVDVDVRIDAALADELQPGQLLDQRRADFRALADQHQRLDVLEARGERLGLLQVVVPHLDVVPRELLEGAQRRHGVEVVVEDGDVHGYPCRNLPEAYHRAPCDTWRSSCQYFWPPARARRARPTPATRPRGTRSRWSANPIATAARRHRVSIAVAWSCSATAKPACSFRITPTGSARYPPPSGAPACAAATSSSSTSRARRTRTSASISAMAALCMRRPPASTCAPITSTRPTGKSISRKPAVWQAR